MYTDSIEHLKRADPVLARVIERVGPCRLEPRREGTHFDSLVRAIVYQQLSGKAAATIHGRMHGLFGDRAPRPAELAATPDEQLRAVGLSRQKLSYIKDLARRVASGELPLDDGEIERLPDEEVISRLVQVKGIGRWTVQMFLLFRLGRRDVLPELDLGVQNAIRRVYNKRRKVTPKEVLAIGARWRPHASVAAWYLWRTLDPEMSDRETRRSRRKDGAKGRTAARKAATRSVKRTAGKRKAVQEKVTRQKPAKQTASARATGTRTTAKHGRR